MLIRELKQGTAAANDPKDSFNGVVFNRKFKMQGLDALLVSLSFDGPRASIWITVNRKEPEFEWKPPGPFATNREKLMWENSISRFIFFIRAVEIEGRQINTQSGQLAQRTD